MNTQQIKSNLNETFHWYFWLDSLRNMWWRFLNSHFLLPPAHSPFSLFPPFSLLPSTQLIFTGKQDFSWHIQQTGKRAVSLSLGFQLPLTDGTPLQYSCLENPMDGGAWWAAVHGVVKSRTRLSDFTFNFMHWRRKWQPTPVFLPGESQGWGSLVGCHLWGHTELDTTEVT